MTVLARILHRSVNESRGFGFALLQDAIQFSFAQPIAFLLSKRVVARLAHTLGVLKELGIPL